MSHLGGHHLGGNWPGGDPASWYPHLWTWLVGELKIGSVLDVGCGEGQAVTYFRQLGCEALGVDGIAGGDEKQLVHDFMLGPVPLDRHFDLCWSCEFVEHVEERYAENYLDAFRSARWLAMTHALPGQGGHHHVNERAPAYWLDLIGTNGFVLDASLSLSARFYAGFNSDPANYFARTGLIFRREP